MTKHLEYTWGFETLSQAIIKKRHKRNTGDIKQSLDLIKKIMKKEKDYEIRCELARAGLVLNRLLVK